MFSVSHKILFGSYCQFLLAHIGSSPMVPNGSQYGSQWFPVFLCENVFRKTIFLFSCFLIFPTFISIYANQTHIYMYTLILQMACEWEEYEDEMTGRKFYYNTNTKERSWKPPRKPRGTSESK